VEIELQYAEIDLQVQIFGTNYTRRWNVDDGWVSWDMLFILCTY
jgi:hypothetical protein